MFICGRFQHYLLKTSSSSDVNQFFNKLSSNFFAPYILQPARPTSKTLIDNIFLNVIDFPAHSGSLTIQLSDHLFQFAILEGFFNDLATRKLNLKEKNFKNFNERESTHWEEILQLNNNDPNLSIENLYSQVNYYIDEFAPCKRVSKKEYKLKSKLWISQDIQFLMWERDKLFHKYCKDNNLERRDNLYNKYKTLRNEITQKKGIVKLDIINLILKRTPVK